MARRRKKAWGPSNPLWRYLHRKGRRASRSTTAPRRARRRLHTMARRRYRRRSGGFGSNRLLKAALFGVGASMLLPKFVPVDSKLAGALGGFYGGGIVGAGIGYFVPSLLGGMTSNSAASW